MSNCDFRCDGGGVVNRPPSPLTMLLSRHTRRREFISLLGVAAAWASASRAQQSAMPVIGFLHQGSREPSALSNAFRKGLSQAGVAAGAVTIEDRAADGHYDRLPALAAELVNLRPVVIVANYLPAALAAKSATQTIPIVFLSGSDPVGSGLVSSINRPDGNITGVAPMFTLLGSKNLELLHELVPKARVIGALAKPSNPNAEHQVKDLQTAARALGQELVAFYADDERQIDASFAAIDERRIGALVVTADGFFFSRQDQIIALAARYHLPVIYPVSQFVTAGGLMSYGANVTDAFRQTGIYAGKIIQGAKPADLPVQLPTKLEFAINLATAKALGLEVPATLLALADEVIE
jgi:putative tryptophan/tyrosine transport system substrate-binding protein